MSDQLEKRVETLEKELSQLKQKLESGNGEKPWWERIAGTFAGDRSYQEAMKLGADYRHSDSPDPGKSE